MAKEMKQSEVNLQKTNIEKQGISVLPALLNVECQMIPQVIVGRLPDGSRTQDSVKVNIQ